MAKLAAFMARARAAAAVLHSCSSARGEKNLRLKQMKSKQGNCVSSAATGETGEKGIPKERLVLATDSKVVSDIKRN